MKTSNDLLVEETYALLQKFLKFEQSIWTDPHALYELEARREHDLRCLYNPIPVGINPRDPWTAQLLSYQGTGQDMEMALLDLKAKITEAFKVSKDKARVKLAQEQQKILEFQALLDEDAVVKS